MAIGNLTPGDGFEIAYLAGGSATIYGIANTSADVISWAQAFTDGDTIASRAVGLLVPIPTLSVI